MRLRPIAIAIVLLVGLTLTLTLASACGGSTTSSSATCSQLVDEYSNVYPAALACTPGASNQCQQQAMSASGCSCESMVQDATQLNAIVAQLRAKGCISATLVACPCAAPFPLTCVANDGGAGGTCTTQPLAGG